ncbi:MAG TPA: anthranilate synthase component I [Bacteroidetes bacterium]|nr:anthranilate synthase component I [Bacteroidota bacterium]
MKFAEFKKLAQPGKIVPVFRKLNADFITPVSAYLKLREDGNYSFLLESVIKGEHLGRYSFIGFNPFRVISIRGQKTVIKEINSNRYSEENFFQLLRLQLYEYESAQIDGLPAFTCGMVGFLGYDMIHHIEILPNSNFDPVKTEDAKLAAYHNIVAFDHLKNEVILIANSFVHPESDVTRLYKDSEDRLNQILDRLNRRLSYNGQFKLDSAKSSSNFKQADFEQAVKKAKDYILSGDIFQVVLSQRFQMDFSGNPFQIYRTLRNINPSPYMFYLDMVDYQLIGSSPEPLIRSNAQELEIIPIAGTRPRGINDEEDKKLAENLLNDPKELAEHVMLVDLARNDLGRVSEFGSVKVHEFKTIERYSHVMHLISKVKSKLREGITSVEAFKAAFPAGTVSGAPKIRAMEIIDELEPDKRGVYAGAVGYFDFSGNMDLCIAIRMILAKGQKLFFQAGAGIVADSDPEKEYEETVYKAVALKKAIIQASEGIHDFIYR